eukprot:Tbor_TRINITY_DN5955_c1_g1::TRINITY_DN5955_c1_g1_i1::g.18300::m.18300/K20292/COG5; conserved oligomeric Golgi complex subunit 5
MFSDDVLMSRDFNPIAFLNHTMHLPNLDQEYARLQRCSDEIDNRIHSAVAEHSEALLDQVHTTTKIVNNTERLQSHLSALSSSCTRLHHTIEIPYDLIQKTGIELRHTTAVLDTTRTIQKLLSAVSKLPTPVTDLHRAAKKLKEVDELLQCDNLTGIYVVDRALADVSAVSASVRARSQELLLSGLTSGCQTDILIALQCLASLGSITTVVTNLMTVRKRDTLKVIMKLDAQTIASEMAEQTDVTIAKECLFSKLESTFRDITSRSQLIMLLLRCLSHKNSSMGATLEGPFSHHNSDPDRVTLLDIIQGGSELFSDYSTSISSQLLEKISKLNKKNNIRGVLITEYPRLYRCVCAFVEGCGDVLDQGQVPKHQFLSRALEDCKRHFETHLLEQQRDKLHNIVTKMNTIVPKSGEENKPANVNFSSSHHDRDHRKSKDSSQDYSSYTFTTYSTPPQATPIDTRPILKIINYSLSAGQQDPHLTLIYLETTLSTLTMLLSKMQEGVSRVQISFSNNTIGTSQSHNIVLTVGHLFHIALANVSADIFTELSGTVSLMPVLDLPAVSEAYIRLKNIITSFSSFHSKVMASFAVNGMKEIWSLVNPYLLLPFGGDDSSSILEKEAVAADGIESLCKMIMTRHLCCFSKAGTKAEETKKRMISSLLLKTVALWCCSPQLVQASKALPSTPEHDAVNRRLRSLFTILSPLHSLERASPFSKTQFCACRVYSMPNHTSLHAFSPLLRMSRLLTERVLMISSVNSVPYLHTCMKVSIDNLVDFLANTSAVISNQQGSGQGMPKPQPGTTQSKQRETFINGVNATALIIGDKDFKSEVDELMSSLW